MRVPRLPTDVSASAAHWCKCLGCPIGEDRRRGKEREREGERERDRGYDSYVFTIFPRISEVAWHQDTSKDRLFNLAKERYAAHRFLGMRTIAAEDQAMQDGATPLFIEYHVKR